MKLKNTLIIQRLGDDTVIVPVGEAAQALHGMMRANDTGAAIVQYLLGGLDEEAAAAKLTEDYNGVDMEHARTAVSEIVHQLRTAGLFVE